MWFQWEIDHQPSGLPLETFPFHRVQPRNLLLQPKMAWLFTTLLRSTKLIKVAAVACCRGVGVLGRGPQMVRHKPQPPSEPCPVAQLQQCHEAMAEQPGQRSCRVWGTRSTVGYVDRLEKCSIEICFFSSRITDSSGDIFMFYECFIDLPKSHAMACSWSAFETLTACSLCQISAILGNGKQEATKKTPDFTKKTAGQYYL